MKLPRNYLAAIPFNPLMYVFLGEGAVALAEFLAENHQIQRLDLRQNEVKIGGLMALCLALKINCSLVSLDLDHVPPQEQVGAVIMWTCGSSAVSLDFRWW